MLGALCPSFLSCLLNDEVACAPSALQDAADQLHAAADILLEVLHPLSEPEASGGGGDGTTQVSRALSRGSGGARSQGSKSSRGGKGQGSVAPSMAASRSKAASTVAPPASVSSKTLKTIASGVGGAASVSETTMFNEDDDM